MKKFRLLGAAVLPAVLACGCSNLSHSEAGALGGGAFGAGLGAIIGKATGHNPAAGALIGGATGALAGGAIGHSADQAEQHRAQVAAAQARQMGLIDVVQMVQSHVSDDLIINEIRTRGAVFNISAQDTIWLKQNGVSDRVVAEMQATATCYPRRVVTTTPAYAERVVVVEEPRPVVGVGLGYTYYGRR
jgi:hypothetical protein